MRAAWPCLATVLVRTAPLEGMKTLSCCSATSCLHSFPPNDDAARQARAVHAVVTWAVHAVVMAQRGARLPPASTQSVSDQATTTSSGHNPGQSPAWQASRGEYTIVPDWDR